MVRFGSFWQFGKKNLNQELEYLDAEPSRYLGSPRESPPRAKFKSFRAPPFWEAIGELDADIDTKMKKVDLEYEPSSSRRQAILDLLLEAYVGDDYDAPSKIQAQNLLMDFAQYEKTVEHIKNTLDLYSHNLDRSTIANLQSILEKNEEIRKKKTADHMANYLKEYNM